MKKVAIIIQARMGSSRLPDKVLLPLAGTPILSWVTMRLARCNHANSVIVATSTSEEDDSIEGFCQQNDVLCFRGSENDVLGRFLGAAHWIQAEVAVRITADCPLVDPEIVDLMITRFLESDLDYTGCVHVRSFPRGLDAEVIRVTALERASDEGIEKRHREHVTPYIYENPRKFRIEPFRANGEWRRQDVRLAIDDETDFDTLEAILQGIDSKSPGEVSVPRIMRLLDVRPDLLRCMAIAEKSHHQKNTDEGIHHEHGFES